jgi:hypothetical protein
MAIRGITFSKQSVTSNDDAHLYKVLLGGRQGRTRGCKMTFGADDINISNGYFVAANRLIEITSVEVVTTPVVATGTTYCRLVFEVDLTKTNTTSVFSQGYFKVLTSNSGYPSVTQQDLENDGNVYQLPFARFTKTVSGIANFVSELETIGYLGENKIIYVDYRGNDETADGTTAAPFKTIQKAIDYLPKNLAGHIAEIDIGFGTYTERVVAKDFYGGKLIIARPGNSCIIEGGIDIDNCSNVETNIYEINKASESARPLFAVKNGSNVVINSNMTFDGIEVSSTGLVVENNSHVAFTTNTTFTSNRCGGAVAASMNCLVTIDTITGGGNMVGMSASRGAIISYKTNTLDTMWGNTAESGGLILTGSNSSTLSGATLDY